MLPDHCHPTTPFLANLSALLNTCLPTPLALLSQTLGTLSICAWLFAQLPQIYKNWTLRSTSGLSIFFLVEWCLGDLSNLLGALFTGQASWQVVVGGYYVFVDTCLVGQWVWYEWIKGGRSATSGREEMGGGNWQWGGGAMAEGDGRSLDEDGSAPMANGSAARVGTRPRIIFRAPTFQDHRPSTSEKEKSSLSATPSSSSTTPTTNTIHRIGPSSPLPSPSPRTILLIACLAAIASASPISTTSPPSPHSTQPSPLYNAGTLLSWLSTLLYLLSRLPQLLKNHRLKSTAGLSPILFFAAFCGNTFYAAALLTNPRAWSDIPPYGAGGWVGAEGSDRAKWVAAATPFFLGAAGVLGMDAGVGVQFLMYGEREVVVKESGGVGGRWRRVRGWMRGWAPSFSEGRKGVGREGEALLRGNGNGYGAAL